MPGTPKVCIHTVQRFGLRQAVFRAVEQEIGQAQEGDREKRHQKAEAPP